MKVELDQIGKRFGLEWVLRGLSMTFHPDEQYAITGPNGSGKSTLLRIISGHLTPSTGKVRFFRHDRKLALSDVYRHLSYAAPYIDLIEELTLQEAIRFHQQFKPLRQGISTREVLDMLALKGATHKPIRYFSSGMKQRLKLVLALTSDTSLLLLDEPTSNLDQQGIQWYRELIDRFAQDRLLIIASNTDVDFDFCSKRISIPAYKPQRKGQSSGRNF